MRTPWALVLWPLLNAVAGASGLGGMDGIAAMVGCGPTTRLPKGVAKCYQGLEHDCTSMVTLRKFCPPSCPYVAPHPDLSCVFECTKADDCHKGNAEFAFPNSTSMVCEPCNIVGCQRCEWKDNAFKCKEALPGFRIELGGRFCAYDWDNRVKKAAPPLVMVVSVFVILVLACVSMLDACGCCGNCMPKEDTPEVSEQADGVVNPLGPSPNESVMDDARDIFEHDPTIKALNQGKRHRLRCKIKDLDQVSNATAKTLAGLRQVPFWVDLRSRFLAGVGLPLFHQWYYFLFCYSCLMCAGSAYIYYSSGLSDVLARTGLANVGHLLLEKDYGSLCSMSLGKGSQLGTKMREFAFRASVGYLAMWVVALCMTLMHAARQKRVAADFYHKHQCLAEFALNIEGFPPEATDEAAVQKFLREAIGHNNLEVSICYDYRGKRDRVHELLEKLIVAADVRAKTYDEALSGLKPQQLGLSQAEKAEVRSWLQPQEGFGGATGSRQARPPPSGQGGSFKLRNAGTVFAVLPHNYDLQLVRRKFDNAPPYMSRTRKGEAAQTKATIPMLPHQVTPEWLAVQPLRWVGQNGEMHQLSIRDVVCEPTDVNWDNLGMAHSAFRCRVAFGSVAMILSFALMAGVLFVPLAAYAIFFINQAGSLPTGIIQTMLGLLIMTGNWLMCLLHIQVSGRMGYSRRDREALVIFKVFAALCLLSFLFNLTMTIFPTGKRSGSYRYLTQPLEELSYVASMQDMSFQAQASGHLFHVLVPGGLFFGYLIFPLQGFVWPFVSVLTFRRWWHRLSFVPDMTARHAEKELEPLGYSAGHDYMGNVVQPVSCSLILFFASGNVWQLWACLAGWSIFMMIFSRYLHLRAVRRCYFSTNRVDAEALVWFAVPLSMVLAASCYWAARLRGWSMWLVPLSWVCGGGIYAFLLTVCIRPLSLPKDEGHACGRAGYDDVRSRRFYDWHNCNPIKVLLSHCQEGEDGETGGIVPFEIGKEYLQVGRAERPPHPLRARDTSFQDLPSSASGLAEACGCLSCLAVPEVETLIERPLKAMSNMTTRRPAGPRRSPNGDSGAELRQLPERMQRDGDTKESPRSAAQGVSNGISNGASNAYLDAQQSSPQSRPRAGSRADGGFAGATPSEAASSPGPSDWLLQQSQAAANSGA